MSSRGANGASRSAKAPKVRRKKVYEAYRDKFEALYAPQTNVTMTASA